MIVKRAWDEIESQYWITLTQYAQIADLSYETVYYRMRHEQKDLGASETGSGGLFFRRDRVIFPPFFGEVSYRQSKLTGEAIMMSSLKAAQWVARDAPMLLEDIVYWGIDKAVAHLLLTAYGLSHDLLDDDSHFDFFWDVEFEISEELEWRQNHER